MSDRPHHSSIAARQEREIAENALHLPMVLRIVEAQMLLIASLADRIAELEREAGRESPPLPPPPDGAREFLEKFIRQAGRP
jgi:hypothetical protein